MSDPEDDYTQREIGRLTAAVEKLTDTIVRLEHRMAETYVRKDVYLEARKNDAEATLALSKELQSLVSLRDWVIKIVVGVVLTALLGLVVYSKGGSA